MGVSICRNGSALYGESAQLGNSGEKPLVCVARYSAELSKKKREKSVSSGSEILLKCPRFSGVFSMSIKEDRKKKKKL